MRHLLISVGIVILAMAGCGTGGGNGGSKNQCVEFCAIARTCSGVTGWKTNDCAKTCMNFGILVATSHCDAPVNAWLACETAQPSQICNKQNPCPDPYIRYEMCINAYCGGADSPSVCNF